MFRPLAPTTVAESPAFRLVDRLLFWPTAEVSKPVAVYEVLPPEDTTTEPLPPVRLLRLFTSNGAGVFPAVLDKVNVTAASVPPLMIVWLLPVATVSVGAEWL